jgi:hypothetical protein
MTVINFLEARAARQGRRPPDAADEVLAARLRRRLRMIDAALREYEGAADELARIETLFGGPRDGRA